MWRKDFEHVLCVKRGLKKLNPADMDLTKEARLYINYSLCRYYRGLRNECKKLWIKKYFHDLQLMVQPV